jgi:hypothetical protein
MAQTSPTASEIFFANDTIPLLLKLLLNNNNDTTTNNNKSPKEKKTLLRRALWIALRNFAKQGGHFVDAVVAGGGMEAAVNCIKGDNIEVKDGAIWLAECLIALGEDHTRQFLELGGVDPLTTCLNNTTTTTTTSSSSNNMSDPALCRAAVATLGCIARQGTASSEALASDGKVLDALRNLLVSATIAATDNSIIGRNSALNSSTSGNIHHVSQDDSRLIRQTVLAIGDIVRSGPHLADIIISKGILESIVKLVSISTSQKGDNNNRRDDPLLRRHCAALLRDTARHGLPQATAVAHCSPGVLHQLIASCISGLTGNDLLPGIIAVGFIGAHAALAPLVADAGAIPALASVLMRESLDHVLSATVWALGQIGRQSHSLAAAVAVTGALAIMADLECSSSVPITTTTTTTTNNSSS